MNDAATFLATIYQGQRGYRELCYIIGDPDDRKNSTFHQEWYVLAQHDKMLARIAELQALGYNVYVGGSTYTKQQRSKEYALPSRAIVIDDAPAGEYSFTVQTGPNSRHAWILTPHWLEPHDRERIARNAAYATGGDKGGWDCTQLVRVPGGLNSKKKYGGAFYVHMVEGTGKTYHLNELEARWPAAQHHERGDSSLAWESIAPYVSNIDRVLARVKPHTITYQQLHNGSGDRSKLRYGLACELLKRYHFPDHCIAAILFHFNWGHLEERGSTRLRADIENCIAEANRLYPDVKRDEPYCITSNPTLPLPQVARASRARKDRPQRVTLDDYRTWLRHQAIGGTTVMMTRKEIAAALGISVATVDRFERILRECDEIERKTHRKRGGTYSYVVIFSAINIAQEPPATAESTADLVLSAEQAQNAEIAHQEAVNAEIEKPHIEVTHRPEWSPQDCAVPASIDLAEAMRAAIERAADVHGRVSKRRVQDTWATFMPAYVRWSDRTYDRVMKRRAQETQIARLIAWAQDPHTQPIELKRKARNLTYQQRLATEKGKAGKAYMLGQMIPYIEDEIEARILRGEIRRKQPRRRTMQPALPVEATERHQAEPYRACVPSPSVVVLPRIDLQQVQAGAVSGSAAPYAPSAEGTAYVVGMIGRLRQRVQQGATS